MLAGKKTPTRRTPTLGRFAPPVQVVIESVLSAARCASAGITCKRRMNRERGNAAQKKWNVLCLVILISPYRFQWNRHGYLELPSPALAARLCGYGTACQASSLHFPFSLLEKIHEKADWIST